MSIGKATISFVMKQKGVQQNVVLVFKAFEYFEAGTKKSSNMHADNWFWIIVETGILRTNFPIIASLPLLNFFKAKEIRNTICFKISCNVSFWILSSQNLPLVHN
jgi:hypothetical protein